MYACTNGTRHGLRMTLSSKCSRVCIVIPAECRRCAGVWANHPPPSGVVAASGSSPFHPTHGPSFRSLSAPLFLIRMKLRSGASRCNPRCISAICFATQTHSRFCPHPPHPSRGLSIKCNNIMMNAHGAAIISYAFA